MSAGQVYGIYKLKTKAMHEKLERIRSAFEEQQKSIIEVKQIFESNISALHEEI